MSKKTAIIFAAGSNRRISNFFNKPKSLLTFNKNNLSIIERLIKIIKKNNFSEIIIITGYKRELLETKLYNQNVKFIFFKNYKNTNNLQTLLFAKNYLQYETYLFFADLIFDEKILKNIIDYKTDFLTVVDTSKVHEGTMRVRINNSNLMEIGSHIPVKNGQGNFIGISKISKYGVEIIKNNLVYFKNNKRDYYTIIFNKMIRNNYKIKYYDCKNLFWKEIDTIEDYNDMKYIVENKKFKY